MHRLASLFVLSLSLAAQDAAAPPARVLQPADPAAREQAAAMLGTMLATVANGEVTEATLRTAQQQVLRTALRRAAERLPDGSAARVRADALLAGQTGPERLRLQIADLVADLTFRPVAEAELPAGVPGYQALDELEIRGYPAYRMVRTDMRGGGMGAFWPLFRHIQDREIAMTTPVQVDYAADNQRASSMAFLYGSPDLGPLGKAGRVEVVDVPAMSVLSIGSRGNERPARVTELHDRLTQWLRTSSEWELDGSMRTMAYNSPSVGGDRRYFEVQVPIRKRTPATAERQDG